MGRLPEHVAGKDSKVGSFDICVGATSMVLRDNTIRLLLCHQLP